MAEIIAEGRGRSAFNLRRILRNPDRNGGPGWPLIQRAARAELDRIEAQRAESHRELLAWYGAIAAGDCPPAEDEYGDTKRRWARYATEAEAAEAMEDWHDYAAYSRSRVAPGRWFFSGPEQKGAVIILHYAMDV